MFFFSHYFCNFILIEYSYVIQFFKIRFSWSFPYAFTAKLSPPSGNTIPRLTYQSYHTTWYSQLLCPLLYDIVFIHFPYLYIVISQYTVTTIILNKLLYLNQLRIRKYHLTLIIMIIKKKSIKLQGLTRIEEIEIHVHCWLECKIVQCYGKQYGNYPKITNVELPCVLVFPLLVYTKNN